MKQEGIPETFGKAVLRGRTDMGMTQRALAQKMTELGVSMDATAITRLENNQREPRFSEGVALSRFLGFDPFLYTPKGFTYAGLEARTIAAYSRAADAVAQLLVSATETLGMHQYTAEDGDEVSREELPARLLEEIRLQTEFDDELWVDGHPVAAFLSSAREWEIDGARKIVSHLLRQLGIEDEDGSET
ncbi:helix-turn-helix transcriptional regulator [Gordonia sp. NB41Y]|uniref:helix-turn-helix domain-containing protein n=1 Tax=Gordonia sp. NB41Y TaxID=875808 RepID=UPI00273C0B8B|nr:helix-turn-helix transcriptional regulator [Gordonia sp. NB41Y]WLP90073.1 helix-turn-helix transcriptional regulator [Gordonia sp. NB41Y]